MTTVTTVPLIADRFSTSSDSGPVSIPPDALSYMVLGLGRNPDRTCGTSASIMPASPATASVSARSANPLSLHLADDHLEDHQREPQQDQADADPETELDVRLQTTRHTGCPLLFECRFGLRAARLPRRRGQRRKRRDGVVGGDDEEQPRE